MEEDGLDAEELAKLVKTKLDRQMCVKILLDCHADPNFKTLKNKMTPLHWASYQGDPVLVKMLIDNGAEQTSTKKSGTNYSECFPVDIAGFCGYKEVVRVFCQDVERKIAAEEAP